MSAGRLQAAAAASARQPHTTHGHLEHRLAAEPVRGGAGEDVAHELAREGHGGELAGLGGRQAEGRHDRAEQEGQERHVDLVDQPRRGDDREDPALVARHGQPLQARRDVGGVRPRDPG
ncbi:hypothetical protein ACU4GA_26280 [Methylobacterium oryzae CBMB20]